MAAPLSPELADWLAEPIPPATPEAREKIGPVATDRPLLVVGAGPAGLAMMAALKESGLDFVGVEAHSRLGGIWDETNPVSSVYQGLRSVTSRFTTHLGEPLPNSWPTYPEHEQLRSYLSQFAESRDIASRIQFATCFDSATRRDDGVWAANLSHGDPPISRQQEFSGVIIASGSHNRNCQQVPPDLWDEAIAAKVTAIHSSDYCSPETFAGKRVLIVGVGNSGSDIAEKLSGVARRTVLSIRTSPWIIPQTMGGVPCDDLDLRNPNVPKWIGMTYFRVMRRLAIGSFRGLGLRSPRCGINDRLPISDRGIVAALRSGRVIVRSNVESLAGGVARFEDKRQTPEPIDAVIFATGFRRMYPLLPELERGQSINELLLFYLFHRTQPGLAYVTEMVGTRSCWPIFVEQAQAVAAYFLAARAGSSNFQALLNRRSAPSPDFKRGLFSLADEYHIDYGAYTRFLRDFAQWVTK